MSRFYSEFPEWWPLFSAPADYEEEAEFFWTTITNASHRPVRSLLELGSGGGNNASYLKAHADLTLVEPAPGMRAVSELLNPGCTHLDGDMRTVRLRRLFDAVFVHDAICYMTTPDDLRRAVETAYLHCAPGGVALFAPDCTRETFRSATDTGGHDGDDGRALRYLEWTWDPDPADTSYTVDYTFLLRDADGSIQGVHDRHVEGLFSRADWMRVLVESGFEPVRVPFAHSEAEPGPLDVFIGIRRFAPDGSTPPPPRHAALDVGSPPSPRR